MSKKKRRLAAIPFTGKWFAERKLKSLSKEAGKLSDRANDLKERVENAKGEAYRTFTASEYERSTEKIDEAMSDICESAEEARETPTGATADKKKIGKKCREALGLKPSGGLPKDKAVAWKACVEKGGPNGYRITPATPTP